jgi:lysophospholipase L1-like esterase
METDPRDQPDPEPDAEPGAGLDREGPPPARVGSLVILGDSISDGGGQAPRYYGLLQDNDDGRYPDWADRDLRTLFPDLRVENAARSGSETGDLLNQVRSLPRNLPGPIVAVITSGGNDIKSAMRNAFMGNDAGDIEATRSHIGDALDSLAGRYPDRKLRIHLANIYDPSDGQGNYGLHCEFARGLGPLSIPSDPVFERWNAAHSEEVERTGQSLVQVHDHFRGHGHNHPDESWYAPDCTHPNRRGHHELRRISWEADHG